MVLLAPCRHDTVALLLRYACPGRIVLRFAAATTGDAEYEGRPTVTFFMNIFRHDMGSENNPGTEPGEQFAPVRMARAPDTGGRLRTRRGAVGWRPVEDEALDFDTPAHPARATSRSVCRPPIPACAAAATERTCCMAIRRW